HRVPVEVVVDHHMTELEVATFAAGLGGYHDLRRFLKAANHFVLLPPRHVPPKLDDLVAAGEEFHNEFLGRVILSEDEDLLARIELQQLLDQADESHRFAISDLTESQD